MTLRSVKVKKTIEIEVKGLGNKIKLKRKTSGKTVEYLAGIAGITRQHWHQIENENFRDGLPEETLRGIENALETNFGVVFDLQCNKKSQKPKANSQQPIEESQQPETKSQQPTANFNQTIAA